MDLLRKIAGVSTPQAPKFRPLALPGVDGEEGDVPPLGAGWSSSSSESSSSPGPSTPSPRSSPVVRRALSRASGSSGYMSRTNTPSCHSSLAYRVNSPDPELDKSRFHRSGTPAIDIVKPKALRAFQVPPTDIVAMPMALEFDESIIVPLKPDMPLKGILKRRESIVSHRDKARGHTYTHAPILLQPRLPLLQPCHRRTQCPLRPVRCGRHIRLRHTRSDRRAQVPHTRPHRHTRIQPRHSHYTGSCCQ